MADEKIEIEIVLDDGTVKKGFAKLERQTKKTGKKVRKNLGIDKLAQKYAKFALVAGAAGVAIASVFTAKVARLASAQDQAVRNLNTALAGAGGFSKEASLGFQALASEIQNNTGVGDELILQQIAIARTFADTNEQAEKLIKASVDLSAATGKSLESSVLNLGKSLSGLTGELGESVKSVRSLTVEQLKAGGAIELLGKQFDGFARKNAQTFTGSMAKLTSAFGDFLEQIGKFVTQSPAIRTAITSAATAFNNMTKALKGVDTDVLFDFVIATSVFAQAVVATSNIVIQAFDQVGLSVSRASLTLRRFFTFDKEKGSALTEAITGINLALAESIATDPNENSPILKFFDSVIEKSTAAKGALAAFGEGVIENQVKVAETLPTFQTAIDAFGGAFEKVRSEIPATQAAIGEARKTVQKDFRAMGDAARDGLARGAGSAFAAFGKALAQGENALEAFVNALIGAIGQQAIAVGTEMILRGVGYSLDPLLSAFGPPLIGAGAALAAFGGVLSAVGGGGGTSGGGAGGGVAASGIETTDGSLGTNVAELDAEPVTKVQIDVSGQVLGNELEIGNQIADVLNKSFQAGGTKVEIA